MQPGIATEVDQDGPFNGIGPHLVETHLAATASKRFSVGVILTIEDATSENYYYSATGWLVKSDATTLTLSPLLERFTAPGWSGAVTVTPAIASDEAVLNVSIPNGFSVRIDFRVEGLSK